MKISLLPNNKDYYANIISKFIAKNQKWDHNVFCLQFVKKSGTTTVLSSYKIFNHVFINKRLYYCCKQFQKNLTKNLNALITIICFQRTYRRTDRQLRRKNQVYSVQSEGDLHTKFQASKSYRFEDIVLTR